MSIGIVKCVGIGLAITMMLPEYHVKGFGIGYSMAIFQNNAEIERVKKRKIEFEKIQKEKEEKLRQAEEENIRRDQEEKVQREFEEKLRREQEEKLRQEQEEKIRKEQEEKLRQEQEEKIRQEQEEKKRREYEEKLRQNHLKVSEELKMKQEELNNLDEIIEFFGALTQQQYQEIAEFDNHNDYFKDLLTTKSIVEILQ